MKKRKGVTHVIDRKTANKVLEDFRKAYPQAAKFGDELLTKSKSMTKREKDLLNAEDIGYIKARKEFESDHKFKVDSMGLEMLSQISNIAEAQTRLVMQIADLVKLCKVIR